MFDSPSHAVAFYTRTASPLQSVEPQINELHAYANSNRLKIFGIYSDEGFSGNRLTRPSLDRLIADSKLGLFKQILVVSPDRVSRKPFDYVQIQMKLSESDVGLNHIQKPSVRSSAHDDGILPFQIK